MAGRLVRVMFLVLLAVAVGLAPVAAQDETEKKDPPKADKDAPATLVVKCYPDALLEIDGQKTEQTGGERRFISPTLKVGTRYYYNVKAFWEPNNYTKITRTRKVYVSAGKETVVDLNKADPAFPDEIKVRYVPTPQKVVDRMLEMGKVGVGDVVYDLGCGDGRIPVTAVAKFKAKSAVGYDIDEERIKESKANAKEAKVEGKVTFDTKDVLKLTSFADASVVTLYMGEDLNKQLAPVLRKTLKPGSRVVSHRFTMGDWKPDVTETITVDGVEYNLHLWTIKGGAKPDDKKKEDDKKADKKDD